MSSAVFYPIYTDLEYTHNGEKKKLEFKVGTIKKLPSGYEFVQLFLFPELKLYIRNPKEPLPTIE